MSYVRLYYAGLWTLCCVLQDRSAQWRALACCCCAPLQAADQMLSSQHAACSDVCYSTYSPAGYYSSSY
jgi:hypothetical protein